VNTQIHTERRKKHMELSTAVVSVKTGGGVPPKKLQKKASAGKTEHFPVIVTLR